MNYLDIEKKLITEFKETLFLPFIKAIKDYNLVKENDRICVCISGGKDSMIMAKLFEMYQKQCGFTFEIRYLVMNPGYNEVNLNLIKLNLEKMNINAEIANTDIFEIANSQDRSPCYLCAKMRRGALYRLARDRGCNKISLGHHFDDVIVTTLMNMLNSGSFQTMIPKLHSKNFEGIELIRPMYLIKEKDIIDFKEKNNLQFIACACKFTESLLKEENEKEQSQRLNTKLLIEKLKTDIPNIEKNIFDSTLNVNVDQIVNYYSGNKKKK